MTTPEDSEATPVEGVQCVAIPLYGFKPIGAQCWPELPADSPTFGWNKPDDDVEAL